MRRWRVEVCVASAGHGEFAGCGLTVGDGHGEHGVAQQSDGHLFHCVAGPERRFGLVRSRIAFSRTEFCGGCCRFGTTRVDPIL